MRKLLLVTIGLALAGCNKPDDKPAESSAKPTASAAAPKASAAPAVAAPKPRRLDPLPLTLVLPDDVKVEKASGSGVFVGQGDPKLHVRTLDTSFDQARKAACDPIVCKVVRWVKEDKALAVAEWSGMLSGFRAFRPIEVGGKKYLCETVGPKGAASPEAAEAVVAQCDQLQPAEGGAR
jgi:hypothetical protein